jgi:hypothetical protein
MLELAERHSQGGPDAKDSLGCFVKADFLDYGREHLKLH